MADQYVDPYSQIGNWDVNYLHPSQYSTIQIHPMTAAHALASIFAGLHDKYTPLEWSQVSGQPMTVPDPVVTPTPATQLAAVTTPVASVPAGETPAGTPGSNEPTATVPAGETPTPVTTPTTPATPTTPTTIAPADLKLKFGNQTINIRDYVQKLATATTLEGNQVFMTLDDGTKVNPFSGQLDIPPGAGFAPGTPVWSNT